MSRARFTGPVAGTYVNFRLTNRIAVASGQTALLVDRIPLDHDFRICEISLDAGGTTATASAIVSDNGNAHNSGAVVVSSGTPKKVTAATLATNGFRKLLKGNALELRVTTDGSGAIPAGGLVAHVTGYFLAHTQPGGRFAEHGQCKMGGPVAGFIMPVTLANTTVVANQALSVVCNWIAPFDCRLEAISFDMRGHTETTGSIIARPANVTKGVFFLGSNYDFDVNEQGILDATTGIPLVNRDISRGDTIALEMGAGVADSVPIMAATAVLWVHVKGHFDNSSIATFSIENEDESFGQVIGGTTSLGGTVGGLRDDVPSGQANLAGPCEGGMIVLPFINKRAANASKRIEDYILLPVAVRMVSVIMSRQVTQTSTREIDKSGSQVNPATATQNIVLHNEGVALPSPGSWTGGNVVFNTPAGEDSQLRNFDGGLRDAPAPPSPSSMEFAMTGAGSAALNDTAHVIGCTRNQIYLLPTND